MLVLITQFTQLSTQWSTKASLMQSSMGLQILLLENGEICIIWILLSACQNLKIKATLSSNMCKHLQCAIHILYIYLLIGQHMTLVVNAFATSNQSLTTYLLVTIQLHTPSRSGWYCLRSGAIFAASSGVAAHSTRRLIKSNSPPNAPRVGNKINVSQTQQIENECLY